MVKGKKWVLEKHFQGFPKKSDLKEVEFNVPKPSDGSVLLEALFLSVDPYMRVIESKNKDYPVGTNVLVGAGWTTHSVSDCKELFKIPALPKGIPLSLALGILGMPGMTANYGLLEVCNPQPGEVVVVSGAAGAVGSTVGQIAKIKGAKVVGFAGSDEKVAWLKELGFDEAFNYKKIKLDTALKSAAPKGINCYFDNIGGEFSATVLDNVAPFGRIACCGAISTYNDSTPTLVPAPQKTLVFKEIKMQGFLIFNHKEHYPEYFKRNVDWIQQGKLKYKEHVTSGFDKMFDAFADLFTGKNIGKAVVKV